MKQLTAEEVIELRRKERVLIDARMQELSDDGLVNFLSGKNEKVDIKNIAEVAAQLHKDVVSRFRGVPVIVDKKLTGYTYYIAISRDLYDQIEQDNEEKSVVFPGGDGDRQICEQCPESQRVICREGNE